MVSRSLMLVALLIASTPAQAFIARNGATVEPLQGTDFHVPFTTLSSPRAFWCAAGDYAVRVLGVPKSTRVYRLSPPPRRSGEGISFTLDPARAQASGLLHLSRSPGLTAGFARFQCESESAQR